MSDTEITNSLRVALREKYMMPEWILMEEVGNATGGRCNRYADALAYNLYPSKNYQKIGFEIKASKGDLRRELKDGSKSNAIAQYCDEWYLLVPKGLCDNEEIPLTWGIMELNNDKLRIKKKAEKLVNKIPFDNDIISGVLQSVMRLARNKYEWNSNILRNKIEKENSARIDEIVSLRIRELEEDVRVFREIKQKLGLRLFGILDSDEFIKQFKLAQRISDKYIEGRASQLEVIAKRLLSESENLRRIK